MIIIPVLWFLLVFAFIAFIWNKMKQRKQKKEKLKEYEEQLRRNKSCFSSQESLVVRTPATTSDIYTANERENPAFASSYSIINVKGSRAILRRACECFVALDFETTGLSPNLNTIIEIGAVRFRNEKECERFSMLVNPYVPLPKKIIELTGITNDMLSDQPGLATALPKLLEFIGDDLLVAHNARFDAGFLVESCKRREIPRKSFQFFDTVAIAQTIFPTLPNHKLGTVATHIRATHENAHRAVDDAAATGSIMLHCFESLGIVVNKAWMKVQPDSVEAAYVDGITQILLEHSVDISKLRYRLDKTGVLQVMSFYPAIKIKLNAKSGPYIMLKEEVKVLQEAFPSRKIEETPPSDMIFQSRFYVQDPATDIVLLQDYICAHVNSANEALGKYTAQIAGDRLDEYLYNYDYINPSA